MGVQSLDQEDPLEKEVAIHSSILAQKIPWTEEPGRLQSMGLQRVRHTEHETSCFLKHNSVAHLMFTVQCKHNFYMH